MNEPPDQPPIPGTAVSTGLCDPPELLEPPELLDPPEPLDPPELPEPLELDSSGPYPPPDPVAGLG